jgi:hypothetical protein
MAIRKADRLVGVNTLSVSRAITRMEGGARKHQCTPGTNVPTTPLKKSGRVGRGCIHETKA